MDLARTLVVTNDFPTRKGGIEAFVAALCERFEPDDVVVYTASMPGDREYDATLPYPVVRDRSSMLLPTPRVRRDVVAAFREHGCDRVLFGASAPLGLLAKPLKDAGAQRAVAITHSAEVWWAKVPGTNRVMRAIGERVDVLTYISGFTRDAIARALTPGGRAKQQRLTPGVDSTRFYPGVGGDEVRARLGIPADAPVAVSSGRLVERKGQDTVIEAWPRVLAAVPQARLLIVGDGPYRPTLEKLVDERGLRSSVLFTGAVPWADVPPYVDAGDVFVMPSRTRLRGLEPEGLPLVFLEAASCALPVVVGRSGGAPDSVEDGVTGVVVDPLSRDEIAARLVELLTDRERSAQMGAKGRERALTGWQWDSIAATCREYLGL